VEIKEEEVVTKKRSSKFINILIFLIILVVSIVMYAKYLGTKGVIVKEYRVESSKLPESFSGIKIVFFSDTLIGNTTFIDDIKEVVDNINLLNPDIVIFGGNLVSDDYKLSKKEISTLSEILNSIDVSIGKYSVKGDLDNSYFDSIMEKTDFIEINNSFELIYNESNYPVCLVGVSSYVKGAYNLETSFEFKSSNPTCYTILFTHEGDIIDKVKDNINKPDVIFAGNSLGGEIRVPFYGGLFRNEGSMSYYEDIYQIDGINVYISSGFGTLETGMRLNNRPSFNFFRLKSLYKN